MNKKLIFIGGAPGIGKSTVAGFLIKDLENCVWLDGDDLWRMNPFLVDENTKAMVEKNIGFVLNSFLREHFSYILFTWVLRSDSIKDTILSGLGQADFDFMHFTLICDEKTLKERLSTDADRITDHSLAIKRLEQSKNGKALKVDTGNKTPSELASMLKNQIISWPAS